MWLLSKASSAKNLARYLCMVDPSEHQCDV
jgi:hypothetical protein